MLKLDANEGVCLLSEAQLARILSTENACRYPESAALERQLAQMLGVPEGNVVATAGADDAIDRAFRVFTGPGRTIATTTPGFVEFLAASRRTGAEFLSVRRYAREAFPLDELCTVIEERSPSLVVLASPDNPFGTMLNEVDFDRIVETCARNGSIFLFDATYIDFADNQEFLFKALDKANVIVTGSFSKSRGLAGFRVGWAAVGKSSGQFIPRMREAGPPYSLSAPAIEAALTVLRENESQRKAYVERIKKEREELYRTMVQVGLGAWPSQANFVTAQVNDASGVVAALKEKGVAVRYWPGEAYVRITCPGNEKDFSTLISALREIANSGGRDEETQDAPREQLEVQ
jgi:histidinol-phosphate aminotransferase